VTYTLDALGRRTGMTATGQSPITYGFSPIDQIASITQNSQSYTFTYLSFAQTNDHVRWGEQELEGG
jgi:hypothetical protein